MPTNVKVTRAKGKQVKVGFSIAFHEDDPRSQDIFTAIGVMLKAILTPEEATEFLRQFEEQRKVVTPPAAER